MTFLIFCDGSFVIQSRCLFLILCCDPVNKWSIKNGNRNHRGLVLNILKSIKQQQKQQQEIPCTFMLDIDLFMSNRVINNQALKRLHCKEHNTRFWIPRNLKCFCSEWIERQNFIFYSWTFSWWLHFVSLAFISMFSLSMFSSKMIN